MIAIKEKALENTCIPSKAMIFPVVTYRYESWTIKKAEHRRIDVFELWCWRRLLEVSWTAKRSNQPILGEVNPEYPLEGLMLKLKLQYLGRQEEKGTTKNEVVGWHHQLSWHELSKLQEIVKDR